jgi:hypothetical protein
VRLRGHPLTGSASRNSNVTATAPFLTKLDDLGNEAEGSLLIGLIQLNACDN